MAFGTFDIFHKGHVSYLNQAKKFSQVLMVVVARDKNVLEIKGQKPQNNEKERLKNIKESKIADLAVLGNLKDKYAFIKKIRPDIICLGYDQKVDMPELKKRLLEFNLKNVKIKRLKPYRPGIYKSSKLKGLGR